MSLTVAVRARLITAITPVAIAAVMLGLFLTGCAKNSLPVSQADYPMRIVGLWQGTVGDSRETISLGSSGTFVCHLHPMGFIANTLSQGVPGKISGTWTIVGTVLTLNIASSQNEHLTNSATTSTIVSFNEDLLVLRSDRGEVSSFQRKTRLLNLFGMRDPAQRQSVG